MGCVHVRYSRTRRKEATFTHRRGEPRQGAAGRRQTWLPFVLQDSFACEGFFLPQREIGLRTETAPSRGSFVKSLLLKYTVAALGYCEVSLWR